MVSVSGVPAFRLSLRLRLSLLLVVLAGLLVPVLVGAQDPESEKQSNAPSRLTAPIDERALVTLKGNVRRDLTPERDLGMVEDAMPIRLYLVLKRSPAQQADLDNLLARQQQPTAPEYHKWLTPKEFGARFGASPEEIARLSSWLESHGFQVKGVLNNASMIDFAGTSAQVREAFHTQLHYYNIQGGKYAANAQDPQVPAALTPVVGGITGLSKIPPPSKHTPVHPVSYDADTHRWHDAADTSRLEPNYSDGAGNYDLTPQDFYTIYNVNPILNGGNFGAGATIGLPEPTDMVYGTVNGTTGAATGGDVVTFRTLFGVAGTLNMTVMHGAGTVTCNDPGITAAEGEANLDAEWANAVAPSAHLIFMSCDNESIGDGFTTALAALIDNNISDVISSSYGSSESVLMASDFTQDDTLASQAAAQGQSFLDAAGDAGAADVDQNTATTAAGGFNVDQFAGTPLVTAVGGTDFSDLYDANQGGSPQSTYWSATNNAFYASALSYIPETPWNSSCADSIIAKNFGFTGAAYCGSLLAAGIDGQVVGGGGGFSAHYAQPSYQPGTLGLPGNATKRAVPDISFFAANGYWMHDLIVCDSTSPSSACTSPSTFGGAGGTSFTAPQFAGVTALLITATGERQGTLNPALYALAKAQFAANATKTVCYSNGQTSNIGVTTGLPAAACIFHDVTTGNNDEPCQAGSPSCYVDAGKTYGMLSTTGSSSLTVGFPSGVGYDEATGLGSVNIANLINKWNTANTSTTKLTASPTTLDAGQSTTLTATVTGGTPTGYTGTAPAAIGSASFAAGATALGSCTLSAGTCNISVAASGLQAGANSITATFTGSGTYPASTSKIVTVTVSNATTAVLTTPTPGSMLTGSSVTFTWTAGTGVANYDLWLGTSGPGSSNLYSTGVTGATSATVNGLQTKGAILYVRLFSEVNGGWQFSDYTYTAGSSAAATMISPLQGATLGSSNVMFTWTAGTLVTKYALWLGTSGPGSSSLYASPLSSAMSVTVPKLPAKGATVYARLYSEGSGGIQYVDYTYTEQ